MSMCTLNSFMSYSLSATCDRSVVFFMCCNFHSSQTYIERSPLRHGKNDFLFKSGQCGFSVAVCNDSYITITRRHFI